MKHFVTLFYYCQKPCLVKCSRKKIHKFANLKTEMNFSLIEMDVLSIIFWNFTERENFFGVTTHITNKLSRIYYMNVVQIWLRKKKSNLRLIFFNYQSSYHCHYLLSKSLILV